MARLEGRIARGSDSTSIGFFDSKVAWIICNICSGESGEDQFEIDSLQDGVSVVAVLPEEPY